MTLVIGHRGASAYEHENSLAAFRRARTLGADGVELDIHVTADGVVVVHHDPFVDDVTIADAPFDRVREHLLPNGESVPSLEEALETLSGLTVYVEAKALPASADAALFRVLDRGPTPERYQMHSFDHRIVARLQASRSDFGYGVLMCEYPLSPLHAVRESHARALWQAQALIDDALVRMAHDAECQIIAWTADDADRIQELVALGVDGICTNRPDVARGLM